MPMFEEDMVGSPQDMQCTVSTVSGVEFSSVVISWMGPGGDFIISDNRVTINPTTCSGDTYNSSLHFNYLMEGDEGNYTCNLTILETSILQSVELQSLAGNTLICIHTYVCTRIMYITLCSPMPLQQACTVLD